ncbi:acetate/propionate family kinase [candidate division KSB1 bacterium]|nr:acetate/propionate family kinase [candidate division KSB1 bacterium]RQW00027.1 MAG: acetate/propionate family kinase [candidate division KSB1 bacterium]
MKIMVCNIGSSSFKFQLLDMTSETQLARGHTERVGSNEASVTYWVYGAKDVEKITAIPSHRHAVRDALEYLTKSNRPALKTLAELDGVGFKTIQAGEKNGSVLLTDDVLQAMEYYKSLAPAHNPPYLTAIYMFKELLPDTPLVGVFEPGFHVSIPRHAKIYGTPYEWIEKYNVIKYGYHGASHRYVTRQTVDVLGLPPDSHKIITCHLGGSSSLCAFKDGTSFDVSMGFSPQTGLLQGTRVGDMDPFILPYIMEKKGVSMHEALIELGENGGLAGLSGISADMRDINAAAERGHERARLARDKFIYDIKRYIGEYIVLMQGLDAITFTGGIGQKDAKLRNEVLTSLAFLGMQIDVAKNNAHAQIISTEQSTIAALVLETNEEIVVARETKKVIHNLSLLSAR